MHNFRKGMLEIICGPMFSGKSEELIKRLKLALIAKQKIQVFKPAIDVRYSKQFVVSHSNQKISCIRIKKSDDIIDLIEDDTIVVGIDECQFLDDSIVNVCNRLVKRGIRVILAGLDQDYRGIPFGKIPELLAIADHVTKSKAICVICGDWASKTQRIQKNDKQVIVGGNKQYQARCRRCWNDGGK